MILVSDVEQHATRRLLQLRIERSILLACSKTVVSAVEIDDPRESLPLEMHAEIGFTHGRDGVLSHRGMPIDAIPRAARARRCEKIAEDAIAVQVRLSA